MKSIVTTLGNVPQKNNKLNSWIYSEQLVHCQECRIIPNYSWVSFWSPDNGLFVRNIYSYLINSITRNCIAEINHCTTQYTYFGVLCHHHSTVGPTRRNIYETRTLPSSQVISPSSSSQYLDWISIWAVTMTLLEFPPSA